MLIFESMELKPADWKDPSALLQMALRTEPGAVQKLAEANPFYRPARLLMGAIELAQGKEILSPLALYFNAEERELLFRVKIMLSLSGKDHSAITTASADAPATALLFPEMKASEESQEPEDSTVNEKNFPEEKLTLTEFRMKSSGGEPGNASDESGPKALEETPAQDLKRAEEDDKSFAADLPEPTDEVLIIGTWPEYEEEKGSGQSVSATLHSEENDVGIEVIVLTDESENKLIGQPESGSAQSELSPPEVNNETDTGLRTFSDWIRLSGASAIRKPVPLPSLKPDQAGIAENPSKTVFSSDKTMAAKKDLQSLETAYLQEAVIAGLLDKEKSLTRDLEGFIDLQIKSKKKKKSIAEPSGDGLPITESMASVLLSQGKKERAVAMYKALSLKFPEKSGYFAALIREIP